MVGHLAMFYMVAQINSVPKLAQVSYLLSHLPSLWHQFGKELVIWVCCINARVRDCLSLLNGAASDPGMIKSCYEMHFCSPPQSVLEPNNFKDGEIGTARLPK